MRHILEGRSPFRLAALGPFPVVSLALVAAAAAVGVYGLGEHVASGSRQAELLPAPAVPAHPESLHGPAPDAHEFARELTGMANQFAAKQGTTARLDRVDCVEAEHGKYMCSFALLRPAQRAECHLIQATWTPMGVDSFKVTLSGLTTRCGSLREAIHSLQ